jgi:protein-L-isoaspartate(D-aspartate) O-methyltransferase
LRREGCTNVELKIANGYHGWSEHAPFDRVIVTAAPDLIPPPLIHQLEKGGKMVLPSGLPDAQQLMLVDKDIDGRVTMKEVLPVQFSQLEALGLPSPCIPKDMRSLATRCCLGNKAPVC